MAWTQTDQADVLTAIQLRLKTALGLADSTCFLSLRPVPPVSPAAAGNEFVTICPMDSQFNEGVFEGAGEAALEENAGVIVTVFTRIRLDRNEHATQALTNATRGLLKKWKKDILEALAGHELLDADGESVLVNQLMPRSCQAPDTGEEGLIGLSIYFDTDFDWSLN
jgi:hypothetical protein